jgi:hypothetical protein
MKTPWYEEAANSISDEKIALHFLDIDCGRGDLLFGTKTENL